MFAVAIIIVMSSCATIVSKSTYPVKINSNPRNARISITDKKGLETYTGTTPLTVFLKASAGYFSRARYQLRISSPGYEDRTVFIESSLDGLYFGNILLEALPVLLIFDPASGAMFKIEETHVNVTLRSATSSLEQELNILDINDVPENLKDKLVEITD